MGNCLEAGDCATRCNGCIDPNSCDIEACSETCFEYAECAFYHTDDPKCDDAPEECAAMCNECLYLPEGYVVPHPEPPMDSGHIDIGDDVPFCGCELYGTRYCNTGRDGWMPCESCELVETEADCLSRGLDESAVKSCYEYCLNTDAPYEGWMNEIPNLHDCGCESSMEMYCNHDDQPGVGECEYCPSVLEGDACNTRGLNLHGEQSCNMYCTSESTPCAAHSDCPAEMPFCYDGECDLCSECHYCHDGVDGGCGPSCDGPTMEDGVDCYGPEPFIPEVATELRIHNNQPWLNIDHAPVEEALANANSFSEQTDYKLYFAGGFALFVGVVAVVYAKKRKLESSVKNDRFHLLLDEEI